MTKKFFLWLTLIISILSFLYYIGLKVKEYRFLESTTFDLHEKTSFHDYADSISLSSNDGTIIIQADMSEKFENLTIEKQFEALYLYTTRVYHFWQYGLKAPSFWDTDLHFYGMTDSKTYQLNLNPTTYNTDLFQSGLKIDGVMVYNLKQFQEKIDQMDKNDEEYKYAKEVIEYSEYFFNLLTSYGHDFNPRKDVDLIFEAVYHKYGITVEQFMELYKKYALRLTQNMSLHIEYN